MSTTAQIFLDAETSLTLAEVSAAVWQAVGTPPPRHMRVEKHPFDGDDEFPCEEYRFAVAIYPDRSLPGSEQEAELREYSRALHERLKATNRFRLMLTYNLGQVLDRFDPATERGTAAE